ncbi:MAG TPA: hypothetical protein VHQ41_03815 [Patescibacteria group bacterium]|nr:hypothetical protein [Patescibacteria group bacterium]
MINHIDIEIYIQILNVPAYAFGMENFQKKTSLSQDELENLLKELHDCKTNPDKIFSISSFKNLAGYCSVAVEIIEDKDDIGTLTGHSLEEVLKAISKLTNSK